MPHNCDTCQFNIGMCVGKGQRNHGKSTYGASIGDMKALFPNGCSAWRVSISALVSDEDIPLTIASIIDEKTSTKKDPL